MQAMVCVLCIPADVQSKSQAPAGSAVLSTANHTVLYSHVLVPAVPSPKEHPHTHTPHKHAHMYTDRCPLYSLIPC